MHQAVRRAAHADQEDHGQLQFDRQQGHSVGFYGVLLPRHSCTGIPSNTAKENIKTCANANVNAYANANANANGGSKTASGTEACS